MGALSVDTPGDPLDASSSQHLKSLKALDPRSWATAGASVLNLCHGTSRVLTMAMSSLTMVLSCSTSRKIAAPI
jgi:hypothetical protein